MNAVFICDYVRTPIGRYGGSLSSVRPDDLGAIPLRALAERNKKMDLSAIDEVIFGCANQAGEDNRNIARMSTLIAGFPQTVPGTTVNRLCGSGLDAIIYAARTIRAGEAHLIISGGIESMSRAPFVLPKATSAFGRANVIHDTTMGWRFVNPVMSKLYGVDTMPETAENVAEDFGVSRVDQDLFAFRSQQKAAAAQRIGRFAREIVPVTIRKHRCDPIVVDLDEHLRPDTTSEDLAKLGSIAKLDGTVTAGNSTGLNDGAAALILASEAGIREHGLTPIAKVLGGATCGVEPRIMGIGPSLASQKLMSRLKLSMSDFDIVEINEAFASQVLASLRSLGIPDDDPRINPNGGAIALGHPLGMSGSRITGTAALELRLTGKKRALSTMCIGVGQGIAIALESAD